VKVIRRGGIAGIPVYANFDTAELPPEQSKVVEAKLLAITEQEPAEPGPPDRFVYHFVLGDQEPGRNLIVHGHLLPRELRPLVDHVRQNGKPGS